MNRRQEKEWDELCIRADRVGSKLGCVAALICSAHPVTTPYPQRQSSDFGHDTHAQRLHRARRLTAEGQRVRAHMRVMQESLSEWSQSVPQV